MYEHIYIYDILYNFGDVASPVKIVILRTRCSSSRNLACCCSVLQCVAVCCSVLQCVAVCCSVLHVLLLMGTAALYRVYANGLDVGFRCRA